MVKSYPGTVRIIGGRWRGKKLELPTECPLRPTPNRLRETLFNWLGPWIIGKRCLDLFSGSGALRSYTCGTASANFSLSTPSERPT